MLNTFKNSKTAARIVVLKILVCFFVYYYFDKGLL